VPTYSDVLTALADPTRRTIFERIAEGPRAVVELADGLPVSRPAVSQHLRILKDASLIIDQKAGARRMYQLKPDGLAVLRAYLDRFWDQALEAFAVVANEEGESDVNG
jgi:DNA-binding transcriptional ArsR family regulator